MSSLKVLIDSFKAILISKIFLFSISWLLFNTYSSKVPLKVSSNTFKIRLKNSDINKGKSAGYRVITYCINENCEVFLITIYSKIDKEDILDTELKELISKLKL